MKWKNQMMRGNGSIRKMFAAFLLSGWLTGVLTGADLTNAEKILIIDEIATQKIKEAKGRDVDLSEVLDAVGQQFPLDPGAASESTDFIEKLKQQVKLKYPASDAELEAKYRQEAESLYSAYKQGDEVTVTYQVYDKTFQVSGLYYKSDPGYVWVGARKLSRKNIPPDEVSRFDVKAAGVKCQQYIQEKINEYHRKRSEYERQLMEDFREEIEFSRNKLKIGKKWLPVRSVVEQKFKEVVASLNQEIARNVLLAKKYRSISNLEYLMSQYPNHPEKDKWLNLMISYKLQKLKNNSYQEAIHILESLMNQYPDHADKGKWLNMVIAYKLHMAQDKNTSSSDSIQILESLISKYPNHVEKNNWEKLLISYKFQLAVRTWSVRSLILLLIAVPLLIVWLTKKFRRR